MHTVIVEHETFNNVFTEVFQGNATCSTDEGSIGVTSQLQATWPLCDWLQKGAKFLNNSAGTEVPKASRSSSCRRVIPLGELGTENICWHIFPKPSSFEFPRRCKLYQQTHVCKVNLQRSLILIKTARTKIVCWLKMYYLPRPAHIGWNRCSSQMPALLDL